MEDINQNQGVDINKLIAQYMDQAVRENILNLHTDNSQSTYDDIHYEEHHQNGSHHTNNSSGWYNSHIDSFHDK